MPGDIPRVGAVKGEDMEPENYDLSFTKWNPDTGIVAEFRKPGRVDWEKVRELMDLMCGHCEESDNGCGICPLYAPGLCRSESEDNFKGYFTLLYMAYGSLPRNKRTGRRIAKRIFKAILKDDPRKEKL